MEKYREEDLKELNKALDGVRKLKSATSSKQARSMRSSVKLAIDIANSCLTLTDEEQELLDEANDYLGFGFFMQFPRGE